MSNILHLEPSERLSEHQMSNEAQPVTFCVPEHIKVFFLSTFSHLKILTLILEQRQCWPALEHRTINLVDFFGLSHN